MFSAEPILKQKILYWKEKKTLPAPTLWLELTSKAVFDEVPINQYYLDDRPEEFYLALLEYFEPEEDEFGEYFNVDTPLM